MDITKKLERGQLVTPRRGINSGRQAKVLRVFGEPGEQAWMTIEYLDTKHPAYECLPENFMLWKEYQQHPYIPSPRTLEWAKRSITDWKRAPLCILEGKRYSVLYRDSFGQGVIGWLISEGYIQRAGTLAAVLREHGETYKEFTAKRKRRGKNLYRPNVPVYQLL